MARRTKKKRWSYSTGERGRNRVRAYEHASGVLMLEFSDRGRRTRLSLGHRDREKAKKAADDAAAGLARSEAPRPAESHELTLGELFEMYLEEVSPKNGVRHQRYDRVASEMFARFFGLGRVVNTLSRRDWDRFARSRQAGGVGPGHGPWGAVNPRTVQKDLSFLRSVLRWATVAGDGHGGVLLERDPTAGAPLPREKNPRRPMLTHAEYQALLGVAGEVDWRFGVALVLAHEAGHRIGAVRSLRWSDVDLEGGWIHWRAETEKTGHAHSSPMTAAARCAFAEARQAAPGIGDAPVLPGVKDPSQPALHYFMRDLWLRAEKLAGLERVAGRGWHSLRRKFATDLAGEPLKVVAELGGWKDCETVVNCYQQPDRATLRAALDRRPPGGSGPQPTQRIDTKALKGPISEPRPRS